MRTTAVVFLLAIAGCPKAAPPRTAETAKGLLQVTDAIQKQLRDLSLALEDDRADPKKIGTVAEALALKPAMFDLRDLPRQVSLAQVELYAAVLEIRNLAESHARIAQTAKITPEGGRAELGVVIVGEEEKPVGAKLVEVGPILCGNKPFASGTCPEGVEADGITYRDHPSRNWTRAAFPSGETVSRGQFVPLVPTFVLDRLVQGNETSIGELWRVQRVAQLKSRVASALDRAQRLEPELRVLVTRPE